METNSSITVGVIQGVGTVIAALVGGLLRESRRIDALFGLFRTRMMRVTGHWQSTWKDARGKECRENFFITHQRGSRLRGYITVPDNAEKKWEVEGIFNGRFLQLFYYPAKDAPDDYSTDYGCYLFDFDMKEGRSFVGYSVGRYFPEAGLLQARHTVFRVGQ